MKLLQDYKDNKFFKKAYRRVQVSYLSFLTEKSKKEALLYFFKNPTLMIVPGFKRVLVKLFLPVYFHRLFKNIRT